jgi:predicted DNA-binding transcriptional regulator AlpA
MEGSGQLRPNLPEAATDQLGRRLDSWKEIAAYLGRSQKTVQRWEETQELPVHRLLHEKRGSVYAYTSELDAWREARKSATESPIVNESRPPIVEIPKRRINEKRLTRPAGPLLIGLIVLLMIIGLGLLRWHRQGTQSRTGSGGRIDSLAVLPLENLSGDTGQEYFADGMTAELITELAKIGSLRVISRTSVMRYKRSRKPLPEIARA